MHPILNNAEFMRQLRDFLPPSDQTSDGDTASMVRDTVQSPQFAQVNIIQTKRMANFLNPCHLGVECF